MLADRCQALALVVRGAIGQRGDQLPNVLDTPGRAALTQLDRLRKASRFDAFPPTGFAERNHAQYLRQPQEPCLWNL
jgi:hypothetical protein